VSRSNIAHVGDNSPEKHMVLGRERRPSLNPRTRRKRQAKAAHDCGTPLAENRQAVCPSSDTCVAVVQFVPRTKPRMRKSPGNTKWCHATWGRRMGLC
jgi:hypothetical protein